MATFKPILFSGAMVRAILKGRKTQTRRAIKPQFPCDAEPNELSDKNDYWQMSWHSGVWWDAVSVDEDSIRKCPYGKPGDFLWVKETYVQCAEKENHKHAKDGFTYRADWSHEDDLCRDFTWKSSIYMPRIASRILLKVVDIKVERVQDIRKKDAIAEGVIDDVWLEWREDVREYAPHGSTIQDERGKFQSVWDSINYRRGYGWEANPWVWVVEFKVVSP